MRTILLAVLVVLAVAMGAFWLSGTDRGSTAGRAGADVVPDLSYDYEARDVIVQQLDASGRLLYQIEASQIAQLPDNGEISATDLTMHYDPPGTDVAGPYRWTLTAASAQLPADIGEVTFTGNVQAQGRLQINNAELQLSTAQLGFNLDTGLISSDEEVTLRWGRSITGTGQPLRVNIKQGTAELGYMRGSLAP